MNSIQFASAVQAAFVKHFPNGYFRTSKLCLGKGFMFSIGLISDIEDQPHHIRDNDPLRISIFLHSTELSETNELGDSKIVIDFSASSLSTLPTEKYYAMGSHKIPCRKINNTAEKAIQALDKYFAKVKETVSQHAAENMIYGQSKIPAKYL